MTSPCSVVLRWSGWLAQTFPFRAGPVAGGFVLSQALAPWHLADASSTLASHSWSIPVRTSARGYIA
jgi:hypothetical protein